MTPEPTSNFQLTKTNFKQFLECPREFWLRHHHPEAIPEPIDAHAQYLIRQGHEVERFVRAVLKQTVDQSEIESQYTLTQGNLLTRFDIFLRKADGSCAIYEVKSSKYVPRTETAKSKREKRELNLYDLGFQVYVARLSGLEVAEAFLVTINGEYERGDDLVPDQLIHFEEVTDEIDGLQSEIAVKVNDALDVIEHGPHQSLDDLCAKKLRCPYIIHTQPHLPEVSIFDIPRINEKRLAALLDIGVVDVLHVPSDADLTDTQREFVNNAQKPPKLKIQHDEIRKFLEILEYPLYFLDYETVNPAIPKFAGMRPFEQITFQFSLHVRESEDGELIHHEHLSDGSGDVQRELVQALRESVGETGTVISWNKSFEQTQNRLLARLYPEHSEFLESLNERMLDLAFPFQKGLYNDPAIKGWSIKNVLPIIVPDLSYEGMAIDGGAIASGYWYMDVYEGSEEKERRMAELRAYCKLDTLGMVRIFDALNDLIRP